jgi:hypothetical protein
MKEKNLMRKSKELNPNPKLGRPRIHDVLQPLPRDIFKILRDVADMSGMPLQLVYEDAVLNGITTLVGKDGMYTNAITVRKGRKDFIAKNLANEPLGPVDQKPEARAETEQVSGASNGELDPGFDDIAGPEKGAIESTGSGFERSGLFEEDLAPAELRNEYSGEPGE